MGLLIACMSGDVAVDDHSNPSLVRIHLRKSKTDQLGRGVDVYLGRTDEDLCPVTAEFAGLFGSSWDGAWPPVRVEQWSLLTK